MIIIYLIISFLLIIIDQIIKFAIVNNFQLGQVKAIIPGIFSLTRLNNTGAAWSIMSGSQWVFIISAIIASIILVYFLFRYRSNKAYAASITLMLAGAIGNLIDRISVGYVTDMFQLDFINFPIFNFADLCLTIGVIVLLVIFIKEE